MFHSGVDTTIVAAFAVGLASFFSPCMLPMVPGYLAAVSGTSSAQDLQQNNWSKILLPSIAFVLTFTLVFIALGMTATSLGSILQTHRTSLDKIAGLLIIAFGLFFVVTPFVPKLNRTWQFQTLMQRASAGSPIMVGAAFAFAWTPCMGPTLGAILTAASTQSSVAQGGVLLAFYSAGMAIPFLITALAFDRATNTFRWLRKHHVVITASSGVILIAMGILVFTDELMRLNGIVQQLLSNLGLDFFYSF